VAVIDSVRRDNMRKALCTSVLLCFIALSSIAIGAEDISPTRKTKCPVCGMFTAMFAGWNAKIEFKDSTTATFDGSKCMFKYFLDIKKYDPSKSRDDIAAVSVNDYYEKTPSDALRAYYVIWSDVYGPMGHEPIPFAKEADAKKFLKEHKGERIIRFKDVDMKLITSLDNP
jgi:copper chaperone NosL